ncbi:MAG: tyrosine-type recombinase/integrase [Syntrophobacteraceae bacterium]
MPIQLYCTTCKKYNKVDAKECVKCGRTFGHGKKRFRVDVSVKGERYFRFYDNLTKARTFEAATRTDMERGEFNLLDHKAKKTTLNDVWDEYLPFAKLNKKTWDDDELHYRKHLKPRFGKKPLQQISIADIDKMKSELMEGRNKHGKPYAPATIKHQLVLLRRLFNVARKWGMFQGQNPCSSVDMPKLDNQIVAYLLDEQRSNLLKVLDEWPCFESACFVRFAFFSGLRRSELFRLRWQDIDFQKGLVTLVPKGGKTNTVPVSEEALNILRSIEKKNDYVFPGKGGKQRVEFKLPWQRIRKKAELPKSFRFHDLRHNYASIMVSNGVDLATVGALLSHKQPSTTARYAHLMPDSVKKAALKSGELLSKRKGRRIPK